MMYLGSIIIGVILAIVGVCPIDFTTHSFSGGDLAILIGIESLWCILYTVAKNK